MDASSFNLLYNDIEKALLESRLQEALQGVQGLLYNISNPALSAEAETIRQDYSMMLSFMQQGATDPQREKIHQSLLQKTFSLLDNAARSFKTANSSGLYAETYHKSHNSGSASAEQIESQITLVQEKMADDRLQPDTTEKEQMLTDGQKTLNRLYNTLFDYIWTDGQSNTPDNEALKTFIDEQQPIRQSLLISAVHLNLTSFFDPQKVRLILYYCSSDHAEVRARAITCLMLTYIKYYNRMKCYPDLCQGIALLGQDQRFKDELSILQRQLLLSLETSKAEKKLKNEILPDLMKNKFYQRHKMGFEEMEEELTNALQGKPNKEWEKSNRQIADSMNKIIEMSKEGIDINLATFSSAKNYQFFRDSANWFAPFEKERDEVRSLFSNGQNTSLYTMLSAGNFCDSDKYSLCLLIKQFTGKERDFMTAQFDSQMEENTDELKRITDKKGNIQYEYSNYLQNLYRFFKLHPQRSQFDDPFKMDLLLTKYKQTAEILNTPQYLTEMADFLMKHEYYQDAIAYIEQAMKSTSVTAEMLQKTAFCHQQNNQPSQAIYYYQQADLLNPDNKWILQQMHLCYAAMGKHEQELKCLETLEAMSPEDTHLSSETGFCLMQLNRYEEAARKFYQLEFNGTRVLPSWRAIAWCNFKMNKFEQAEKYYGKILSNEKVNWEDYLNAGHTAWCLGKLPQAVELYKTYLEKYKQKAKGSDLLEPFDNDRDELCAHGIKPLDIALMRDIIISLPA